MNLESGAFVEPASLETLILFWSKMEMLHYPGAGETKRYLLDMKKQQQMMAEQQMAAQQAQMGDVMNQIDAQAKADAEAAANEQAEEAAAAQQAKAQAEPRNDPAGLFQ